MKVIFYKDDIGEWRWRMRARNGNIMADSGEGYSSKRNAFRAFRRLMDYMRGAELVRVEWV